MKQKLDNVLVLIEKAEKHAEELVNKVHIPANVPSVLDGILGALQKADSELNKIIETL